MATLQAIHTLKDPSFSGWQGQTNVDYECSYDHITNRTTVTFSEGTFRYYGLRNYVTTATADITVIATDNPEVSASAVMEFNGTTNGGNSYKDATPDPISVTVQHGSAAGEKSVTISVSSMISVYITAQGGKEYVGAQASVTVSTGSRAGIIYVGDKIGVPYVYLKGKWHVGVLHATDAGLWKLGVGYIFLNRSITVTYDDEGNVYLSGVTATHDGDGNVVMGGATASDDGNGNITIT